MVDRARLDRLLEVIATELGVLADLSAEDDHTLVDDPTAIRAVKYAFVVAIEAAIDAAQHVITATDRRVPESFADSFTVLQEAGVLDADLATSMGAAARFRNLLVHGYADVDDHQVVTILRTRPADLRAFRRVMAALPDEPD